MSEKNHLWSAVVYHLDQAVCVLDQEGIITLVNPSFLALFGVKASACQGIPYRDFLTDQGLDGTTLAQLVTDEVNQAYDFQSSSRKYMRTYSVTSQEYAEISHIIYIEEIDADAYHSQKLSLPIVSSIQDSIIVTNLAGTITYWNEAASQIFGRSSQEMLGKPIQEFNPDFNPKDFLAKVQENSDYYERYDWFFRRLDAREVWVDVRISPLYDQFSEKLGGILGVSKDITDKKRQTIELNRSQQRLSSIVNSQSNYLVRTDLEGNFTYANTTFLKKFGYGPEIMGQSFIHTVHPDDIDYCNQIAFRCIQEPGVPFPIKIRKPKGAYDYYETYWEFLGVGEQTLEVSEIQAVGYDITERKDHEEALRKYTDRLQLAVETARIGIWELDLRIQVLDWNDQLLEIYGITREAFEQDYGYWKSLVHPEDAPGAEAEIGKVMEGKEVFDVEFRVIRPSGETRFINASARPVYDKEGKLVRMVGINLDITRLKKYAEELKAKNQELSKANAELDKFVYHTSHNLRAPLANIMGLIEIMFQEDSASERANYLELTRKCVQNLDETIGDIIDYSRNARLGIHKVSIQLIDLIHEVVNGLIYMHQAKNIELKLLVPEEMLVLTDPTRLKIILANLLSNAIKYMHPQRPNPWVLVEAKGQDRFFYIKVQDNGIGIPENYAERVFEMFFRASNQDVGSGLGLYIVKETIQQLEGKLSLSSQPEVGTTFELTFPQ